MNQSQATGKDYSCPMHPDVRQPSAGKCPKCGMKLVEASKVAHGKIAEENWRKAHPASAPQHQH